MRKVFALTLVVLVSALISPQVAGAHGIHSNEGLSLARGSSVRGDVMLAFRLSHEMGNVNLSVFDIAGRRVATLVSGSAGAGEHRVQFSGRGLRMGMYLARLTTDHGAYTARFVLMP